MRISSLKVVNFRGIKRVELTNLGQMVIIAGTNGSGKSSIFDAIRLIKSMYNGYQPNEWQQWMGEFQIAITQSGVYFEQIFNAAGLPFEIEAEFELDQEEVTFLRDNARQYVEEAAWKRIVPELGGWQNAASASFAVQFRVHEPQVREVVAQELPLLIDELSQSSFKIRVFSDAFGRIHLTQAKVMELIFGMDKPGTIGVIDYHGPQRFFQREPKQGININLDAIRQQQSSSRLYNYGNKYTNVKAEMAGSFVQEVFAREAGVPQNDAPGLTETLKELFRTFFPDKEFDGPKPQTDGTLAFPVRSRDGSVHDLDDLSAGEKEILYGYLRIRNTAPKHSVILLDEPELHLNPKLIRGLPRFYKKYLGEALNNQIWLVTHSDALLREVVGQEGYSIFHTVTSSSVSFEDQQAKQLMAGEDAERLIVDLVGDLASYRPGGKVVIFEGGGDAEFDLRMTSLLFPTIMQEVNGISAGNKNRVRSLHDILDVAASEAKIPFKVYSICDRDTDDVPMSSATRLQWDRYHIENYLLEPSFILPVLRALDINKFDTEKAVEQELVAAARSCVPDVVRGIIVSDAGKLLLQAISLNGNPNAGEIAKEISQAAARSSTKINNILQVNLSEENIEAKYLELVAKYNKDLTNGRWKRTLPGREILTRFVHKNVKIGYTHFRNLVLHRMADAGFQPEGMAKQLNKI